MEEIFEDMLYKESRLKHEENLKNITQEEDI